MSSSSAMARILIKGGKVVNDDCTQEADVYIENGIIQQVGKELMIPGGAKVIDASGKLVLPGGIDTSVHLEESFMNATTADDFYSGTKAALAGGTTMVIGHVLPERNESLLEAYEKCRSSADSKSCCDYALHVGVTWWGPKVRAEMEKLVREHGVNSFQMFMAYKDMFMLRDSELFQALQHCKDIGAIARVHAENGELVTEGAKEALDLGISEMSCDCAHCPIYLVNVSSMSAGDVVATAKMQGKVVHGETTTAHAVLNGMQYYHQDWSHAAAHVTVPPLRLDPSTPNYLMSLLGNDTLNVLGSDHRPFTIKQKAMGKDDFTKIPHGLPGIQDRMSVIWEKGVIGGKMDENRFVAVTSSNAAKIYNFYPRKGRIIPGADADVVVWDPEGSKTISVDSQVQGGDINLYEGLRCHGVPLVTISRGRLVYENGMFTCAEGSGKFCPLRTFPDYLYKKMVQREKSQAVKAVEREPYTGDVVAVVNSGKRDFGASDLDTPTRPCTRHGGVRDLHESSFSLSGAQIDDNIPKRSSARILAPPGGRSSGIW
uniref:Dihydropyrimidinase like 5a n=1 Tax=Acanthochromis polyacanthus TaxID=80966 RepID=A0A3Q1FH22_9TELE